LQKVPNVIACTEDRFMPLNHNDAHSSISLGLRNGIGHLAIHHRSDGVLFVQSIESEGHHPRIDVGQYVINEES